MRSSSKEGEINRNELDEIPITEDMYTNDVALAAAKDDTTDVDGEKSQTVYRGLNDGAKST